MSDLSTRCCFCDKIKSVPCRVQKKWRIYMEKENYNGYDNKERKRYENLQPDEIVERIMDTHALAGSDTATMYRRRNKQNNMEQNEVSQNTTTSVDWSGGAGEETIIGRRTRRYAQEDGDQQYTMRFQTIQSEDESMYHTQTGFDNQYQAEFDNMYQTQTGFDNQKQNIQFTPQYSPHQPNYDNFEDYTDLYQEQADYEPNTNYNVYQNSYQDSEYPDNNTYQEEKPRKGPLMQEIEITLPGPGGKEEPMEGREGRRNRHYDFDDYDLARGAKQMDLDELYSDDYDEEDSISFRPGKKLGILFSVILIALIGFLGFRCVSLASKLKAAEKIIAENEDISAKYETLQMDNLKLEEELNTLKAGGTPTQAEGQSQEQGQENNTTANANNNVEGNFDLYTVTGSDTWWSLAQKFYGDGTQYTRILEANGKKESDYVKAGDKLKIPKK